MTGMTLLSIWLTPSKRHPDEYRDLKVGEISLLVISLFEQILKQVQDDNLIIILPSLKRHTCHPYEYRDLSASQHNFPSAEADGKGYQLFN